ncbi:hypothetical protein H4R33_001497 [Dimargaris cristalligena]|nr:hypothetical protein H4R33_001497 [Dimargaris cristalligena]
MTDNQAMLAEIQRLKADNKPGKQSDPSKKLTTAEKIREFTRVNRRTLVRDNLLNAAVPSRPRAKRTTRYCTFYNRFGRCSAGEKCPFIHDPNRIAMCTRFLRGACTLGDKCPFSHDLKPERVPLCSHFQRGLCTKEDCPYLHIKMSADAPVCRDFVEEGFCSRGKQCDKRHVYECPDFTERGECSKPNCKLPHRAKAAQKAEKKPKDASERFKPRPKKETREEDPESTTADGETAAAAQAEPKSKPKAKRYMELAQDELDDVEGEELVENQATTTPHSTSKAGFLTNMDFISFDDMGGDGELVD